MADWQASLVKLLPFLGPRVKRDQAVELFDQLESLLVAGLPLDRALHVLGSSADNGPMRDLVYRILLDIEKGRTFAEALSEHPDLFKILEVSMVRAGEASGALPLVMRQLADYHTEQREFRRFLLTASIYPVTLLLFGIMAMAGIFIFVLPKFAEAYGDLASQSTTVALLIGISDGVRNYGPYALIALIAAILGFRAWLRTPDGRRKVQAFLLGVPGLKHLLLKAELARVLHTLGILLSTGVPVVTALRLSRALTGWLALEQALTEAEKHLRDGRGLAKPFLANPLFPPLVGQMALVGEESGALDKMLAKVGQRLEREVRDRMRALLAIVEPVLIIGIGVMIGAVVVSMIGAIFSLNELPV
jgi:type II secretory pathway component PulF